ncbi:MAG: TIGR02281 family clan AA aspartic protease [Betaproteobacteria bacterium]|uniref:TIGR02281 family clan AA aspartic protease n=1 Tax=Candidatus Proximibacter danicus TaxID=2954365 RepID=A0A9D7K0H5_9PROT|nr:TIGR02281 family clan AA aspartic protease [Candidatus Proximibacter danicus]
MCHFRALAIVCLSFPALVAAEVGVAGVFPGKALLVVDGGAPQAVAIGTTTPEGVKVLAIDGEVVTLRVSGEKRTLRVGQHVVSQKTQDGRQETTLAADSRGHFYAGGSVNGRSVRFLVDTGATMVSLGAGDASRVGIDWGKGQPGLSQTANGQARVWKVRFDTVRVGEVTLHGVDGLVHEGDMPVALLGMSFLSRMEIRNEGSHMTLKKRF